MKKIIVFFILALFLVQPAQAKLLPRFQNTKSISKKTASSGIAISPKLRSDRKALSIYFNNLKGARNLTYTLIYQTNGKDEGVSGSIDSSSGNSASRELLFGTCSSGVCRYHPRIANMRLEVVTELLSGKKTLRRFRIKV